MVEHRIPVAYRAVVLAGVLLVLGLLFKQLATLLLAVLMTIIIAIPLSAGATRLQRFGVPRPLGALATLLFGLTILAGVLALITPTFVDQTNKFVDQVPGIVNDLEETIGSVTGDKPSEVGDKVQNYLERYTKHPERLIGPVTSIGLSVAGVGAALIVMLLTAYYISVRPQPLVDGALRLVPPRRRVHAREVMERLRDAWIGWMQGVVLDMFISGTLLFIGLTIIGLDFALVFAVLIVYIAVQQVESNMIIPLVMSRTTRLHPAVIAIGVLAVGRLFGIVGLFVAVPIISAVVILVQETWVREIEAADERRTAEALKVPSPGATVSDAVEAPPEPYPAPEAEEPASRF